MLQLCEVTYPMDADLKYNGWECKPENRSAHGCEGDTWWFQNVRKANQVMCAVVLMTGGTIPVSWWGTIIRQSSCLGIPQIWVRDITFYLGLVPALAMVRSKLVNVDYAFFWSSPSANFHAIPKGKAQGRAGNIPTAPNVTDRHQWVPIASKYVTQVMKSHSMCWSVPNLFTWNLNQFPTILIARTRVFVPSLTWFTVICLSASTKGSWYGESVHLLIRIII